MEHLALIFASENFSAAPDAAGAAPVSAPPMLARILLLEGLDTIQVEGIPGDKQDLTKSTLSGGLAGRVQAALAVCTDPVVLKQRVTDWLMGEIDKFSASVSFSLTTSTLTVCVI
jgi:hypothetical protein